MSRQLLLLCAVLLVSAGTAQNLHDEMERFINCPRQGRLKSGAAPTGKLLRLTLEKNRTDAPTRIDSSVTLDSLLALGDDRQRWNQGRAIGAEITGYVAWVIPNFLGEECNCYRTDDAHIDDHIDLVLSPSDYNNFPRHVIVEVTPRMKFLAKKRGLDWSTSGLTKQFLHSQVTVRGWLLYDYGHENVAQHTHPIDPKKRNWRATCWEIHPITSIRLAK